MAKIVKLNNIAPIFISNSFEFLTNNNDANVADCTTEPNNSNGHSSMGDEPAVKDPRPESFYVKITTYWRDLANKIEEIAE